MKTKHVQLTIDFELKISDKAILYQDSLISLKKDIRTMIGETPFYYFLDEKDHDIFATKIKIKESNPE